MSLLTGKSLFIKVRDHLLAQNAKSRDDEDQICVYRNKDGLRCAAGCLIDDKHYLPYFEGYGLKLVEFSSSVGSGKVSSSVGSGKVWAAIFASGVEDTPDNRSLICTLQCIHDGDDPPSLWPRL